MIRQHWDALSRYVRTRHPSLYRVHVVEGLTLAVALWVVSIGAGLLIPLDRPIAWEGLRNVLLVLSACAAMGYAVASHSRRSSTRRVPTRDFITQGAALALVSLAISTASLGGMLTFRLQATLALDAEDARVVNCEAWNRGRSERSVRPPDEFAARSPSPSVCADVRSDPDYRFRTIEEVGYESAASHLTWHGDWLDPHFEARAHAYAEALVGHGFPNSALGPRVRDFLTFYSGASLFVAAFALLLLSGHDRGSHKRNDVRGIAAGFGTIISAWAIVLWAERSAIWEQSVGYVDGSIIPVLVLLVLALALGFSIRRAVRYPSGRVFGIVSAMSVAAFLVAMSLVTFWTDQFEPPYRHSPLPLFLAMGFASFVYSIWLHRRVASLPD